MTYFKHTEMPSYIKDPQFNSHYSDIMNLYVLWCLILQIKTVHSPSSFWRGRSSFEVLVILVYAFIILSHVSEHIAMYNIGYIILDI